MNEYPYMSDKFEIIMNTLNIHSPSDSPRLTEEAVCSENQGEFKCEPEKPLCETTETPEEFAQYCDRFLV